MHEFPLEKLFDNVHTDYTAGNWKCFM